MRSLIGVLCLCLLLETVMCGRFSLGLLIERRDITCFSPCFVTQTDEVSACLIVITESDRPIWWVLSRDSPVFLLAAIFISCLEEEKGDLILSNRQPASKCVPSLPSIVLLWVIFFPYQHETFSPDSWWRCRVMCACTWWDRGNSIERASSDDGLTFLSPLLFKSGFCERYLRVKVTSEPPL